MELVFKVNVVAPILKRWYVISRQGGIIRSYQQLRNRNLLRHFLHMWRLNSKHEGIASLDMWASSNYKRNVRAFHSGADVVNGASVVRPSQGLDAIGAGSGRASRINNNVGQAQGKIAAATRKSTGKNGGRDSPPQVRNSGREFPFGGNNSTLESEYDQPQAANYDVDDNGDYDQQPTSLRVQRGTPGSSPSNASKASSGSSFINVHATSNNNITANHKRMLIQHKPSTGVSFDEDDFAHEKGTDEDF